MDTVLGPGLGIGVPVWKGKVRVRERERGREGSGRMSCMGWGAAYMYCLHALGLLVGGMGSDV